MGTHRQRAAPQVVRRHHRRGYLVRTQRRFDLAFILARRVQKLRQQRPQCRLIVAKPAPQHRAIHHAGGRIDRRRQRNPATERCAEPRDRYRLGQIGVHAALQASLLLAAHGIRGDRDDGSSDPANCCFPRADLAGQRVPVHPRHVHVSQHDGIATRLPKRQCLYAIDRDIDQQSQQAEQTHHDLAIYRMVIDHQHAAASRTDGRQRLRRIGGRERQRLRRGTQPQRDAEHRADARFAPHLHVTIHQLREPPHDRETKAAAAEPARGRAVGLGEWLEQSRPFVCTDADSGIGHLQRHVVPALANRRRRRADMDAAALRKLHRIAEQIEQDLAHPHRVADQCVG